MLRAYNAFLTCALVSVSLVVNGNGDSRPKASASWLQPHTTRVARGCARCLLGRAIVLLDTMDRV